MKIGGATSQIGDPSGRIASREILKRGTREDNTHIIEEQLKHLFNNAKELASGCNTGAPSSSEPKGFVSNNLAWTERLSFLKILSTLGTGFRLGPMLSRDTYAMLLPLDNRSCADLS